MEPIDRLNELLAEAENVFDAENSQAGVSAFVELEQGVKFTFGKREGEWGFYVERGANATRLANP